MRARATTASSLKADVMVENFTPIAGNMTRLSVFNGVKGSTSYDIVVDGATIIVHLGYPGTFDHNDGFYNTDIKAGTYDIRFVLRGQPSNVVFDLPNTVLQAGTNYYIAAVGTPDKPQAVTSQSGLPTK